MRPLLVLVALATLAGCLAPASTLQSASRPASAPALPKEFTWTGHVLASEIEGPSHQQPTEQALWTVQQEGFLFDVKELPQTFEVSLAWNGEGSSMIMLHSHKAHGTNVYVEHVSKMTPEKAKCIRVPPTDLAQGEWQVMVHSDGARQADFTLNVRMFGGLGQIVEGAYHGHQPEDGSFDVDPHEVDACGDAAGAA